jgi:hypothetical protein
MSTLGSQGKIKGIGAPRLSKPAETKVLEEWIEAQYSAPASIPPASGIVDSCMRP